MTIVFLTSDLLAASKIVPAAEYSLRTVSTLDALREPAAEADLIIVDLNGLSVEQIASAGSLRSGAARPRVIAFGPHVHEAKLQAAREAGCDAVFTRGQFFAQTGAILRQFAAAPRQEP
ncbi:MAG TPA: histidine kinase [Pirellulales bacterium]|jgi:DNA-binding NarL/FixJ family response regulator|nr:histidine kinase [Pirellulales bacterium]